MRVGKDGCDLMQSSAVTFNCFALDHCHARIFLIAGVKRLA
jgi:hypothetical protein